MKQSIKDYATSYFASIEKRLSLHVSEVACFNKKKAHKKYEFGRAFQIGRLSKGNFIDDKKSLTSMLEEHAHLFGEDA